MELGKLIEPWLQSEGLNIEVKGLCNDSRLIQPGDLFFAYPGANIDGRDYIAQAFAQGARAALFEVTNWQLSKDLEEQGCCIPMHNLADHLGKIASRFYGNPSSNMDLTGVTGTNGKTTIAYMLTQAHAALSAKSAYIGTLGYGPHQNLKSLANTTPDALFLQNLLSEYRQTGINKICMEVSSHALAQNRVDGLEFKQALFTNLTQDHLDFHLTMAAYAAAKARLFAFSELKWAIINNDDPYAEYMAQQRSKQCQLLTYAVNAKADVKASQCHTNLSGTSVVVQSEWGIQQLRMNAIGLFNIYNMLAVYSSLLLDGYPVTRVVDVIDRLRSAPGRMEIVSQMPTIIVDYAHTPDALANVLTTLSPLKKGNIIVVFGCGGDRDKGKRPIMGKIAAHYADIVIITNDNPRTENPEQIIADISEGISSWDKVYKIPDRESAIHKAIDLANAEDIILVAGKGHESYQQIGNVRHHFSDQEVIKKLINQEEKSI